MFAPVVFPIPTRKLATRLALGTGLFACAAAAAFASCDGRHGRTGAPVAAPVGRGDRAQGPGAQGPSPIPPNGAWRFAGYGDSRSHADRHRSVVHAIARRNPELLMFTGDAQNSYSPAALDQWLAVVRQPEPLRQVMDAGRFLFARGNHDLGISADPHWSALSHQPPGSTDDRHGFLYRNVYFVNLGCSLACAVDDAAGAAFLDVELRKPAAVGARWKIVFAHGPIYDSGRAHFTAGNPALEAVLDAHHVDVHFAGHEHLYERSHQVRGGAVVDRGDALKAGRGTVYVVSGGGGADFYPFSEPRLPTFHAGMEQRNHFCEFEASDATLTVRARDVEDRVFDQFSITK